MGKQLGGPGSPSPRKRKDREQQEQQEQQRQQQAHTPSKGAGSSMQCGTPSPGKQAKTTTPTAGASPTAVAARSPTALASHADDAPLLPASSSFQAWESCSSLLREAVVDAGCPAAALVPLRPSLRRIKDDLVRLLDEAVSSHNGNASLLVLGPPGTGKTLVVERALWEVCTKHNGDPTGGTAKSAAAATAATSTSAADPAAAPGGAIGVRNVCVVRLNGLLQPDERTAFQEVARQLCREFGQKFVKSASFDENLVFLKGMLHALYKCLKKVVFLVDEFQQYAKKGKQQMLYYLLDMLQDSKIQAAVIGVSSAHNVAEDLEKRVLSRVGRRRVLVTFPAPPHDEVMSGTSGPAASSSPGGGAVGSAVGSPAAAGGAGSAAASGPDGGAAAAAGAAGDSYDGLLYDMLALHPGMAALAGLSEGAAAAHNEAVTAALKDGRVVECLSKAAMIGAPPQHLGLAAEAALAGWGDDLRRQAAAAAAAAAAVSAVAAGGETQGRRGRQAQGGVAAAAPMQLGWSHLLSALRSVVDAPERALVDVVSGLAVLPLVLLVAAHRLMRKGGALCNFEMVWDEYRSIQCQRGAIAFSKQAAAAAWQSLPLSGLAHYTDANIESRGRDLSYAGVVLLVGSSDLDAGIREHPHCPDAVTRFHMQEI